jgi:hypothetical protein
LIFFIPASRYKQDTLLSHRPAPEIEKMVFPVASVRLLARQTGIFRLKNGQNSRYPTEFTRMWDYCRR